MSVWLSKHFTVWKKNVQKIFQFIIIEIFTAMNPKLKGLRLFLRGADAPVAVCAGKY